MGEAKWRREKIAARVKDNEAWKDIHDLSRQCRLLVLQPTQVAAVLNNQALLAFVKDKNSLSNLIRVLAGDLSRLNTQLQELDNIYAEHREVDAAGNLLKTSAQTPDELMMTLGLGEKYLQFTSLFDGIVNPNLTAILDAIRVAEHLMKVAAEDRGEDGAKAAEQVLESLRVDTQAARQLIAETTGAIPTTIHAESPTLPPAAPELAASAND